MIIIGYKLEPNYEKIIKRIKEKGYEKEFNRKVLTAQIQAVFNVTRQPTIKRHLQSMDRMGFIKQSSADGIWTFGSRFDGDSSLPEEESDEKTEAPEAPEIDEIDKRAEAAGA